MLAGVCECVREWRLHCMQMQLLFNLIHWSTTIVPNRAETWMSLNWFFKSIRDCLWNGTLVIFPHVTSTNPESWLTLKHHPPHVAHSSRLSKVRNQMCASSCRWLVITWVFWGSLFFFCLLIFFFFALRHILKLISLAYVDFSLLAL